MACADQEASAIMQLSKGKTPSNSMCATFNKDVLKGVDVTVDGVNGVCRIGKHYIRCVEREDGSLPGQIPPVTTCATVSTPNWLLPLNDASLSSAM
jgi:hypothetical protein